MKDLILITAYTPDDRRKQILMNLVKSAIHPDFDIMVSSHSSIPNEICKLVNFTVFERENLLLTDIDYKYSMFYSADNFTITSTEVANFNHVIAAIRVLGIGINLAKSLGYTKVHYIEYDSLIEKHDELIENSKLLDTHSAVYYRPITNDPICDVTYPNSPLSLNLNTISDKWFDITYESLMKFISDNEHKTIEDYEQTLLFEINDCIEKPMITFGKIKDMNLALSVIYDTPESPWIIPFVDHDHQLFILAESRDPNNPIRITCIINDSITHNYEVSAFMQWLTAPIGMYYEVSTLKILLNDKLIKQYDFDSIDRTKFADRNKLM
jgi:hypothetical protein